MELPAQIAESHTTAAHVALEVLHEIRNPLARHLLGPHRQRAYCCLGYNSAKMQLTREESSALIRSERETAEHADVQECPAKTIRP